MITENIGSLKIHKLSQEQYDRALAAGNIDENALYLTPEEGVDLDGYATLEDLNDKADKDHVHDIYETKDDAQSKLDEIKDYTNTVAAGKADINHDHDENYDAIGSAAVVQSNLDAISDSFDAHIDNADIHVTAAKKTNWDTAYTHSQSTHARTDATKVAKSSTNGNILINGTETVVYTHPTGTNPHGTTKSDVGLGNVNNTSDANKPVSTAQQAAIDAVQANVDTVSDGLADHVDNVDIHFTAEERTKLSGIATGANKYVHPNSGVTAGTYKSVTVDSQGHVTGGTNPTTLAGYGITDAATSSDLDALSDIVDGKADVSHDHDDYATTSYVDSTFAKKSDITDVDLSNYETKENASAKLDEAKQYTDTVASSKANKEHTHDDIYDVKGAADTALASSKEYTDSKTSGLASTSTVETQISAHNTSTSAHSDIRDLITDLTTKLNNFLDVDDTTTDQLSEVIALINNNKGTLESLTTSKVNVSDIVDNLTTSSTSKVLSAKQGVAIKALIDALQSEVDGKADSLHQHTITAKASDDDVVVLTGTNGTDSVSYTASHANSGVTAGTYRSVTVNAKGHVTGGTNPTTLSGYGITDAASKASFDSHNSDTTKHITAAERTNWNAAEKNAKEYADELVAQKTSIQLITLEEDD